MHSVFLPLIAAGLATFAHAYTKPGANTWGPLLTPDLTNSITQGKDFAVTWDPEDHPTDGVTVSLVLCTGPSSNCVPADTAIASGIPAAQKSYDWKVPCDLAPGQQNTATGYGMLIIVDGTGEFQYSTQFSCLENKSCASSSSSSSRPAVNATTTTLPGGSVLIGPPAQQTGSYTWTSTEVANGTTVTYTGIATSTGGRGSWGGETTTTPVSPGISSSGEYTWGASQTTYSNVPGTTVIGSTTYAAPATSAAPAATNAITSAPSPSASQFAGSADQVSWNAAGLVVAGAVALFAL